MPDAGRVVVTNTTPLIALAVATGSLDVLRSLYQRVLVPSAVADEILAAGDAAPGAHAFLAATWLERKPDVVVSSYLSNSLDRGEAAVMINAGLHPCPAGANRGGGGLQGSGTSGCLRMGVGAGGTAKQNRLQYSTQKTSSSKTKFQ
ncbi:MAG: hypothetical protein Q8O52_18215 [Sulfuritalea sp.]|nr:hypothetical protein [Sulfuritalea sp.]